MTSSFTSHLKSKMKSKRYLSIKEQKRTKANISANGVRVCRYCKSSIPPTRRTFCSAECVHEWKIRSNNKYMREHIYLRDLGICAVCNGDTRYDRIRLENLQREARLHSNKQAEANLNLFLTSLNVTIKESMKSLWHADHINPVKWGGGLAGLNNLQTLCVKCHKSKTKSQRKARNGKE